MVFFLDFLKNHKEKTGFCMSFLVLPSAEFSLCLIFGPAIFLYSYLSVGNDCGITIFIFKITQY